MTPQPNPGDYVPLGGKGTVPHVTTPGAADADKNGVTTQGASIVQMQEEAWRLRAEAAAAGAEELMACNATVSKVLARNYFGTGCPEGETVYDALRLALCSDDGWSGELTTLAAQLAALESACTKARTLLGATDKSAGTQISTVDT